MVRVAALQLASGTDVDGNLEACVRLIDQAAREHHPALMVLPEFCNHISWYDDADHAKRVAVQLEGPFLSAIAERAKQHATTVVLNVSLLHEDGHITVSSLMYGPDGTLRMRADKQTLMGHENDFFARAEQTSEVVDTGFARVAMYPCRDGVTMETPRCLALGGAQILCNSLNSFALDEASLHVPARAPENRCFVVAANKVGPLIPEAMLESVSEATHIPVAFLQGAGESQIVAPDGSVLAKGPREGEAVVVAEIDPALADDKLRPDGTHLFEVRRPELYRSIGHKPRPRRAAHAADTLRAAIWTPDTDAEDLVEAACEAARAFAREGGELLVLPELFFLTEADVGEDVQSAAEAFEPIVRALCEACRESPLHVVTSLVERVDGRDYHMGVLLGQAGIVARQPQLHACARHPWTSLGKRQEVFRMPYAQVAMLVGDDARHPELAKVAAIDGAHLLACPIDVSEPWEVQTGLLSRSAENRVCVVAATRTKEAGTGVLLDLEREFTLMTEWQERSFDGNISYPNVTRAEGAPGLTSAELHPDAANNKVMSKDTDLLDKRPWWLVDALLRRPASPSPQDTAEDAARDDELAASEEQPAASEEQLAASEEQPAASAGAADAAAGDEDATPQAAGAEPPDA